MLIEIVIKWSWWSDDHNDHAGFPFSLDICCDQYVDWDCGLDVITRISLNDHDDHDDGKVTMIMLTFSLICCELSLRIHLILRR